jgi:hypothetical protein
MIRSGSIISNKIAYLWFGGILSISILAGLGFFVVNFRDIQRIPQLEKHFSTPEGVYCDCFDVMSMGHEAHEFIAVTITKDSATYQVGDDGDGHISWYRVIRSSGCDAPQSTVQSIGNLLTPLCITIDKVSPGEADRFWIFETEYPKAPMMFVRIRPSQDFQFSRDTSNKELELCKIDSIPISFDDFKSQIEKSGSDFAVLKNHRS